MTLSIGLDIGGTKLAAAAFSPTGEKLAEKIVPTPDNYDAFLFACCDVVGMVELELHGQGTLGVCVPGALDHELGTVRVANISCLNDKPFYADLKVVLKHEVRIENDANCIALAESIDGAGRGYQIVLGITISTGLGSGLVVNGRIVNGPNGLTGEIGHLPLPFRTPEDGPMVECLCGQKGCIDKTASGMGLAQLHHFMTGRLLQPPEIAKQAAVGDKDALDVLDRYYEIVAKAMIVPIQTIDPDIIVVSGGVTALPKLFEEVPKRWGKYCLVKNTKTLFVPAKHGPIASVRGAALLWNNEAVRR